VFEKVTIKEYCERENISRTTVDNRIKSGQIETIKEGRNRFVKVYKVCKPTFTNPLQTPLQTIDPKKEYIKTLKATIKEQKKELKGTRKELKKVTHLLLEEKDQNKIEKDESIQILKQYIGEVKLLQDKTTQKDDVIEVDQPKSKKKKDKKKSKKDKSKKKKKRN